MDPRPPSPIRYTRSFFPSNTNCTTPPLPISRLRIISDVRLPTIPFYTPPVRRFSPAVTDDVAQLPENNLVTPTIRVSSPTPLSPSILPNLSQLSLSTSFEFPQPSTSTEKDESIDPTPLPSSPSASSSSHLLDLESPVPKKTYADSIRNSTFHKEIPPLPIFPTRNIPRIAPAIPPNPSRQIPSLMSLLIPSPIRSFQDVPQSAPSIPINPSPRRQIPSLMSLPIEPPPNWTFPSSGLLLGRNQTVYLSRTCWRCGHRGHVQETCPQPRH